MNQKKDITILLVEDEAIIALSAKKVLEKYGYNIILASSGEEACNIAANNSDVDLILMDIDLGDGIDGPEAAIRILSKRTIPVVFLSSHTEPEIVEKTEQITSYGYVVKNSGTTVLLASIKMAFKLFEANRQIQESEVKQRAMISNISDVIGIISSDGIFKYKSTNIEKWFGWEPSDLVGKDYKITIHPEDTERIVKEFLKLFQVDNLTISVEFRYRCKNNIYKWVELTAVNCINDFAINGVLINYHNITERKQAEEAIEKRIIALTRPLMHDTAVDFNDLFNLDDIQIIQDQFASVTNVASIITSPDGTPITRPSNFTHLCEGIVRKTEKGLCNCYKSDAELGAPDLQGPIVKPCLSGGLWDAGASIKVGGHHIANWLVGQVRDETQTDEAMLAYAREIGANEFEFLKAFHEVPSMSQDQFQKVAQSLYTLANQLSNSAYQNIEQARFINERKDIERALLESERNLRLVTDNMTETVWLMDMNLNITWMSPSVEKTRGYTREELAGLSLNQHITAESFAVMMKAVAEELTPEKLNDPDTEIVHYFELEFYRKEGGTFWGDTSATVIRDSEGKPSGILCTGRDISEHKAANKALIDGEKRLSYAMEATSDGLYDMNLVTGEIYCNSRYYNMVGYELYEIPASIEAWGSMLYPDDRDYAVGRLMDMLASKNEFMEMEYRINTKSGGFIWVLDRSKIVEYDDSGKPVRIVGTHVDISERKEVEEALRNSEKIHRLLADNVSDVIWTMDFSGHFTYISPSVKKLRGYTPGEVLQQSLQDSLTPESAAIAQAAFENAVVQISMGLDDPVFHGEIEQLCKDGSTVWTEVRTTLMRNDAGEVVSILGVTRDISERKLSDLILRESEEKYRLLVEHSSDLIWSISPKGEFLYISPSIERISGYTPSSVTGTFFKSYVHPDDLILLQEHIGKNIKSEKAGSGLVIRMRHSDGEWYFHMGTSEPVYGSDGNIKSIVGVSRDITERIVYENKIQNLLNEKELILKEVHHRVKNNMSTILNLLTLQLDMQESPETKGVLFDAAGRVQSMMVLYDKLYKSDSESVLSLKEYFTALVEEIISIFPRRESVKVKLNMENIMLSTKILSPLGIIVNELITNSMKYAFSDYDNAEISLTVSMKKSSVQIIFRDNGRGLPESVSIESSTGFGMQLISMLTSQIGGRISIERAGGTCFTIEFEI